MRQSIGRKKVARYRRETGLDILAANVRGNTGHRIDLLCADGSIFYWDRKSGEMRKAERLSWDVEKRRLRK